VNGLPMNRPPRNGWGIENLFDELAVCDDMEIMYAARAGQEEAEDE
jgi:hypothetical protein